MTPLPKKQEKIIEEFQQSYQVQINIRKKQFVVRNSSKERFFYLFRQV